eukprot:NODE_532_length_7089_cov_0.272103.p1 type:complete len:962 gc:universal NODE_532_length_7089_cov_0.272103:6302-3417(-)
MTKNSLIFPFALYSSATHHEITSILYDKCVYLGFDNGMIVQDLKLLLISHVAPISAFHTTSLPDYSSHRHQRVLLSGCHDGQLLLWANDGNLLRRTLVFNHIIKTIAATSEFIAVGGYTHEVVILDYSLQITNKIATSDWSLTCIQLGNQLVQISFHGTITVYDNFKPVKKYDKGRDMASHISLNKDNSTAVLIGKKYISLVETSKFDVGMSLKCEDGSSWLFAQFYDKQIIAWTRNRLYVLDIKLAVINSVELPSIFGGYLNDNVFYGIFSEKMALFKLPLDDPNAELAKIPLWNFTSDLYTCLEFIPPNRVIFGTNEGRVKMTTIGRLFTSDHFDIDFEAHQGRVSCMLVIHNMLITGGEDCKINFWDLTTFKLKNNLSCLGGDVIQFLLPSNDFTDLSHCVISISEDNSLSIIDYKEFKCKFSFSGMLYPIIEIGWRSRESLLLITCRDGSTYCWSLQTSHLDRILNDHSREVLDHCDAHFKVSWKKDLSTLNLSKLSAVPISAASDFKLLAQVLIINTKNIVHNVHQGHLNKPSVSKKKTTHKQKNDSLTVSLTNWDIKPVLNVEEELDILTGMCSALIPWHINDEFDDYCKSLNLAPPIKKLTIGITGMDNALSLLLPSDSPLDSWCTSGFLTSAQLLAIGSVLKAMEFTSANKFLFSRVMSTILESLPVFVGSEYYPPSLDFLLRFYNDSDDEIREASRFVFNKTMSLMSQELINVKLREKMELIEQLLKDASIPITKTTARSLFLLGIIYSEFNMDPSIFVPCIVKILKMANPSQYSGRVAICDLFLSDYEYWSKFIQKQDILDSLFNMLSITHNEEEEVLSNSAQKALLNICFIDPSTFIKRLQTNLFLVKKCTEKLAILKLLLTTISKDALFMKPLIPDIAFIIVKLLDPGSPHLREGLNEIIKNLLLAMVSRYPSVAFNSHSNKLAVGLNNGKIIVYDVSSGAKAYVLSVI